MDIIRVPSPAVEADREASNAKASQTRADIDYIAMMMDIDLYEDNDTGIIKGVERSE